MTDRQIQQRLASCRWVRVIPRVFAIDGVPDSWHGRLMAFTLWAGSGSAASHTSAARLWELQGLRVVRFEIVTTRHLTEIPGLEIHRSFRLPPQDIVRRSGISVTTIERTVMDVCAVVRPWEAERTLDWAVDRGLTSLDRLRKMLERDGRRGRNGGALFRSLLDQRDPTKAVPKGVLATDFLRYLRRYGLPPPIAEFRIQSEDGFVADVDFAYPEKKIVFEVDGYATHSGKEMFERDRERDGRLQALRWRPVRVTHRALKNDRLAAVITQLQAD